MLSERIKEKRLEKGLTQKQLAEEVGIRQQVVAGYERGIKQPSPPVLKALAEQLECTSDYLLGLEPREE